MNGTTLENQRHKYIMGGETRKKYRKRKDFVQKQRLQSEMDFSSLPHFLLYFVNYLFLSFNLKCYTK